MQQLPTQGICHNIRLTMMVTQTEIIVFQELEPPFMPRIQLFFIEQVLQTLVITEHLKSRSKKIMSPNFKHEHNDCQL